MKTTTAILSAVLLLASTATQARILRVNSVPRLATTCTLCFTSLQTAYNAAQNNDTIHIEPSGASYGSLVIAKKLVIIGPGYKLGTNPSTYNDSLQANTQMATVKLFTLNTGSEGSVIMGLRFTVNIGGITLNTTSNITIKRNFFDGEGIDLPAAGVVDDLTIAENYFSGIGIAVANNSGVQSLTNCIIRNNFFSGKISLDGTNDVYTNIILSNNTFNYTGTHELRNAQVLNNVFNLCSVSNTNNTVMNNLSTITLPPGTGNMIVTMTSVGIPVANGTDDGKWDIPAHPTYAPSGQDAYGMYSGTSSYRLSGIPNIPAIYTLRSTVNTIPGGTVDVILSTRSNN